MPLFDLAIATGRCFGCFFLRRHKPKCPCRLNAKGSVQDTTCVAFEQVFLQDGGDHEAIVGFITSLLGCSTQNQGEQLLIIEGAEEKASSGTAAVSGCVKALGKKHNQAAAKYSHSSSLLRLPKAFDHGSTGIPWEHPLPDNII